MDNKTADREERKREVWPWRILYVVDNADFDVVQLPCSRKFRTLHSADVGVSVTDDWRRTQTKGTSEKSRAGAGRKAHQSSLGRSNVYDVKMSSWKEKTRLWKRSSTVLRRIRFLELVVLPPRLDQTWYRCLHYHWHQLECHRQCQRTTIQCCRRISSLVVGTVLMTEAQKSWDLTTLFFHTSRIEFCVRLTTHHSPILDLQTFLHHLKFVQRFLLPPVG